MREFEFDVENNLIELQAQLLDGSHRVAPYASFYIRDPKLRHIHKASVRDRVLFQSVVRILEPLYEKRFYFDSFASRLRKGTHAGMHRLERFLKSASANGIRTAWALKGDIRRFFDSIDHVILLELLTGHKAFDMRTKNLLEKIITSFEKSPGKGLPLGNVTSQLFAGVYLHELDHFIKQVLKIRRYVRYCDDFVIVEKSVKKFSAYTGAIQQFLNDRLLLDPHPEKIITKKYAQGIDFLGYILRPHHRLIRTRTKKRMFRRINNKNAASYGGVLSHCHSYKLRSRIERLYDLRLATMARRQAPRARKGKARV